MGQVARLLGGVTLLALAVTASPVAVAQRGEATSSSPWRCLVPPVESCVTRHGRLSSQNGIAHMIWLIGTTRIVAVRETRVPRFAERYLEMTSPDQSYLFGDFEVCPLEADRPGHMRSVCVSGASRLVVQNLKRDRPPFRLLSTWPAIPGR